MSTAVFLLSCHRRAEAHLSSSGCFLRLRGAVLGDETAVAMAGCNTSSLQWMAGGGGDQAGGEAVLF